MLNEAEMQRQEKEAQANAWSAVGLAWELGYMIAIPAVVLGFGGAYLDKYLQTSPLFMLIGLFVILGALRNTPYGLFNLAGTIADWYVGLFV